MDRLVNGRFLISITDLLSIVYAIAFTDRNRPTGGHPRTEFLIARKDRDLLLIKMSVSAATRSSVQPLPMPATIVYLLIFLVTSGPKI